MNMLPTTAEAIRAILRADPSLTPMDQKRVITFLRNGNAVKGTAQPQPATKLFPSIIRNDQAAKELNRSVRSIHNLCSQGLLLKAKITGRTRCAGVTRESFTALLNALAGEAP